MGILAKDKDYVSVAFTDEVLRMAHLRLSPSKIEVLGVIRRDVKDVAEEEKLKIITTALTNFNITKPQAISIISSHAATTKNIEIPSLDAGEIRSIIDLQAGRHTPYSREEIIIDYINIGVYQRNYSKILLVIVNRNTVRQQLNILEQAGLKIQKVLFAPEGIVRFYSKTQGLGKDEIPSGIIDVGSQFTDFSVAFHGNVITCRSIPIGLNHLSSESAAAVDKLVEELRKSIESYQNEDIEKVPERYILSNSAGPTQELQKKLQDILHANVSVVSYCEGVQVAQAAQKAITDASTESFLDVIAPVAVSNESMIDLVPEEIKMQRSIEQKGIEVAKSGIFALVVLVFLCGIFFSKVYFKNSILQSLKEGHDAQRTEATALGNISTKAGIVRDFLQSRLTSLDVINELYAIVPDEIYLRSVSLDEEGSITIEGISESMSRVFSLVGDLEDSQLFKGVKTTSTAAKKERGKDVASFQIVFKLEGAADDDETEEEAPAPTEESEK